MNGKQKVKMASRSCRRNGVWTATCDRAAFVQNEAGERPDVAVFCDVNILGCLAESLGGS